MIENFQTVGAIPEPSHYPLLSLLQFGEVPNRPKQPLFRVVMASSVKCLVGGHFVRDGYVGYKIRPRYRGVGDKWILEKWLPPSELPGMDEATYYAVNKDPVTGLCLTGPYPKEGTYFLCHTFPTGDLGMNPELVAALVRKAQFNSKTANQRAILDSLEKEDRADDRRRFDQVKEAQSAFGARPFSSTLVHSTEKSKPTPKLVPVEQMSLPHSGPAMLGRGRRMNVMAQSKPDQQFTDHQLSLIGR
jgi:hypothetical protein